MESKRRPSKVPFHYSPLLSELMIPFSLHRDPTIGVWTGPTKRDFATAVINLSVVPVDGWSLMPDSGRVARRCPYLDEPLTQKD